MRRIEHRVFVGAAAVALIHALDDAFLHRQPGVPSGQHAVAAVLSAVAVIAATGVYRTARPGLRSALALVLGLLAFTNGVLHVVHIADGGAAGSDVTGALAAIAGAVLVGLALAVPLLSRREVVKSRRRRWAHRAVGLAALVVGLFAFVAPTSVAIVQTHKYREPIGAPPSAAYRPVAFESTDGLTLEGWYVRSRNRAAVIVVHGGGGDRTGALRHARLLERLGFGVLVYDSRGRGESEGNHNAFGWGWEKDVAGAIDFLEARPDVDDDRIGGLGLSTGADVLIEVAAHDRRMAAVVSDGATARSFADHRNSVGLDPSAPFVWTMVNATRVLSGTSHGEPLEELVAKVAPTPLLLIAAGKGVAAERDLNAVYAAAANEPFDYWDLPDVRHTNAIEERPHEYRRRVLEVFQTLVARSPEHAQPHRPTEKGVLDVP
jgi:alpha/beta superfamily hydrolase